MARYGYEFNRPGQPEFHYWGHYETPFADRPYGADYRGGRRGGYGGDFRTGPRRGYGRDFGGWGREGGGSCAGRGAYGWDFAGARYGRDFAHGRWGRGYYREHGPTQWGPDRDFGNYNMDRGFRNLYPYRQYDRGWNTGW